MTDVNLVAALLLGFLGSSHCLVMCGGIGAALGAASSGSRRAPIVLLFQLGRIGSYTLLGAGLGAALGLVDGALVLPVLSVLSGLLLMAMGLYLANWWLGLQWLERRGSAIWRLIEPLSRRLLPIQRARDAVLVGACWGFLPCGLIYSALAWSATAASAPHSAMLMFCFGVGTLPAMLATGLAGQRISGLLKMKTLRRLSAIVLIAMGAWTAASALGVGAAGDTGHAHHHQNL